jgi:hypothetical protein
METCVVETGLLRKKPCGHPGIAQCANCEIPLCAQHALPQFSAGKKKTGTFMCKECDDARLEYEKNQAGDKPAEGVKRAANPPPPKAAAAAPANPPAAPAKGAPAEAAKADDAPLEFTPSDKKK